MDPARHKGEAPGLPVQGPHLRLRSEPELPADFVPLRLVLQPSGAVIEVDRPDMVVGRHTEADVRLPLPDVSRRHCRLQFLEGCWQVIDLNSLNGVQVNGEQVLQAPLAHDDLLRIGGFTFAVEIGRASSGGHVQSILKTLTTGSSRRAS
jgi:pSer/pThr/pTyr-binding forkhead associated (FHA) protein